jgi:hypothetical protein
MATSKVCGELLIAGNQFENILIIALKALKGDRLQHPAICTLFLSGEKLEQKGTQKNDVQPS